eukprot:3212060-Prymnesium_polylepis.2
MPSRGPDVSTVEAMGRQCAPHAARVELSWYESSDKRTAAGQRVGTRRVRRGALHAYSFAPAPAEEGGALCAT